MSNEPEELGTTGEWKRQAAFLRQTLPPNSGFQDTEYSEWQKVAIWTFIVIVLVASLYFLVVGGHRRGVIAGLASGWTQLAGSR